jgi:hypothetical protein
VSSRVVFCAVMDGAYPYWDAYVSGLLTEDDNNTSYGSYPHDDNDDFNKAAWRMIQSRRQLKPVRLKNFSKKGNVNCRVECRAVCMYVSMYVCIYVCM